jgi:hypothetical protein
MFGRAFISVSLRSRFLLPSWEPGPGEGIRSITALCGRLLRGTHGEHMTAARIGGS